MTSAFSTNDTENVSRQTEHVISVGNLNEIWDEHRLDECVKWIELGECKKVCLQFSDDLIPFSTEIINDLKSKIEIELCILGDTSYGSCCVDEIAASHVNASAIIHFGHACLSKVSRLPVHYVFTKFTFDAAKFVQEFEKTFPNADEDVLVFYSTGLFYHLDEIQTALSSYRNVSIAQLALNEKPDNLFWKMPKKCLSNTTCVWIGDDDQSLFNSCLTANAKQWMRCDRHSYQFETIQSPLETNWRRRRNFLVEKCKDAQAIGIVAGTLAVDGYLNAVQRIQTLARNRGIRTYVFSVGKINPAKLANFLEVDCFVFVGCPENNVYNSRDFYKPLLTVFEAELALNPAWYDQYPNIYSVDFNEILPNGKHYKAAENPNRDSSEEYDVSLVSGRVRHLTVVSSDEMTNDGNNGQIEKKSNQLMNSDSSNAFNNRSWTGLDPRLGNHEPAQITKGRSGIALKYTENEH